MIPEMARCKNKVCSILFGLHNYLVCTYTPLFRLDLCNWIVLLNFSLVNGFACSFYCSSLSTCLSLH